MAAPAGRVRAQGTQSRVRDRNPDPARGAVSRMPGGNGRILLARGVPAGGRNHLRVRHLQRQPAAARSRPRSMPDPGAIERLQAICARLSPVLAESKVLAQQACYRPVTQDGLPLIGPVPGMKGAYVATGHSVWGILNAPATGEAMAELIVEGEGTHGRPVAFRHRAVSRPVRGPERGGRCRPAACTVSLRGLQVSSRRGSCRTRLGRARRRPSPPRWAG